MALIPGTRLGPHEITAQIAVGGTGEAYRATDLSLQIALGPLTNCHSGRNRSFGM